MLNIHEIAPHVNIDKKCFEKIQFLLVDIRFYTVFIISASAEESSSILRGISAQATPMKILLEKIMSEKNLSIRQVAIATGLPKSTVADIMSGKKSPRMDAMEQLAKGLKVRISDLYESPYK